MALIGRRARDDAEAIGRRVYAALAGYVRGIALVGLVDAILIGIALVIIGVPLVVPIMIITFFAAFVPLIGAFVAGLVAVLIALGQGDSWTRSSSSARSSSYSRSKVICSTRC